ncbi:MAG: monovalent cation/H+ antiporter complex subunit F [Luteolibacter sp.]
MFTSIEQIPAWVILVAQAIIAAAMLLAGWRIWKGPSIPDRIVALDLLAALIMAQTVLLAITSGFVSYLDVATAIAVISFLATVAFARYLENKDVPL